MLWDEPKIFFLERRYFFSIILSEFLKNRVALQQASFIASILYFPMLLFSGTTLTLEVMPKAMQTVVGVFPLTQGITMMKHAFLGIGPGSILPTICVMLALTALCTLLSLRFFRWE